MTKCKDQALSSSIDKAQNGSKFWLLSLICDGIFRGFFKTHEELRLSILNSTLPLSEDTRIVQTTLIDSEMPELKASSTKGLTESYNLSGELLQTYSKLFIADLRVQILKESRGQPDKTETGIVEMQTTTSPYTISRFLAYAGRTFSQQVQRGKDYSHLNPVTVLVLLTKRGCPILR